MTSKQLRHSNSLWQCSDFRKISEQKVFKPFKVSSGSDEQDSSDEDAESDTDRHNEQHTYTYTHTYIHTHQHKDWTFHAACDLDIWPSDLHSTIRRIFFCAFSACAFLWPHGVERWSTFWPPYCTVIYKRRRCQPSPNPLVHDISLLSYNPCGTGCRRFSFSWTRFAIHLLTMYRSFVAAGAACDSLNFSYMHYITLRLMRTASEPKTQNSKNAVLSVCKAQIVIYPKIAYS